MKIDWNMKGDLRGFSESVEINWIRLERRGDPKTVSTINTPSTPKKTGTVKRHPTSSHTPSPGHPKKKSVTASPSTAVLFLRKPYLRRAQRRLPMLSLPPQLWRTHRWSLAPLTRQPRISSNPMNSSSSKTPGTPTNLTGRLKIAEARIVVLDKACKQTGQHVLKVTGLGCGADGSVEVGGEENVGAGGTKYRMSL